MLNAAVFLAVYLYGRKWHPQLAFVLSLATCIIMILLARLDPSWILVSLLLSMVYLRILRMPDQQPGFRKLFADHKIHTSQKALPAVLEVLGEKQWHYSESFFTGKSGSIIPYYFWQGHTKSFVSSGEYVRKTTYAHYIAFIFPPGAVSEGFKQQVSAAADRSRKSVLQRLKFSFRPDTETPDLVTTASDGSFVVQYYTLQESACYERRFAWMNQQLNETGKPAAAATVRLN